MVNPFWRDIFLNFSEVCEFNKENTVSSAEEVLSQPIWLNSNIKIGGKLYINEN